MFEEEILDLIVHFINGVISFKYAEKFLCGKFKERRQALIKWSAIYATGQFCFGKLTESLTFYERFINVVPYILLLFLLQNIFFEKNRARQLFVTVSFTAGWDILRFIASPAAHALLSVWSPFWAWGFNRAIELYSESVEKIILIMEVVNRTAIFLVITLCRAIQIGILIFYLRMTARRFARQDYELKMQDSLFLIFPCVTVFVIDLTVRLMAFSVDNGTMFLIYDRVPATLVLLPLVSFLLLGIIISSVILFQNLIQYKDEEQKRLLLENRVVEVHREVEELQDIYADMRGLRHDLRNHISNLSAYFRKNSAASDSEIENYLQKMTETVERLDFSDKTGNPITDIILHQARQQAKKRAINFDAEFYFVDRFDVYDISVILNNALQNALEANGINKIYIHSNERGGLYFIEVENNFDGEINFDETSDLPTTTKTEKNLHGIGLANIRRCAKKYLGDIDIEISEKHGVKNFRLTVMLYKKADDKV